MALLSREVATNYLWHAVVTHFFAHSTVGLATRRALQQVSATFEKRRRRGTAPRFFRVVLLAFVCATSVLSAPRAGAQAIDVAFRGVNFAYAGNTAVLTAAVIHNYSSITSNNLRIELWAVAAPYAGGDTIGYKLAEYQLAPLATGSEYTNVNSGLIAFRALPVGVWYFVMFLTEYSASSTVDDGYFIDDWVNFSGTLTVGNPSPTALAVEYYYAAWDFYFVTAFPDEIAALDGGAFGGVWQRTEQAFQVWPQPNATSTPTCRFFSIGFAPKSSHFYTPFPAECQFVKTNPADVAAWEFENIAFYVQLADATGHCAGGTTPLFRLYNNGKGGAPNHRYTTNTLIFDAMTAQGWVFEGNGNTKVFACVPQ